MLILVYRRGEPYNLMPLHPHLLFLPHKNLRFTDRIEIRISYPSVCLHENGFSIGSGDVE